MAFLAGFDFGSTTSSFMLAEAALERNCVTGRRQFSAPRLIYRSDSVFTPIDGEAIDFPALEALLGDWRRHWHGHDEDLAAAGAIVTGLAARRRNASGIRELIRRHFGEAVVATADDPSLESWLAFMGGCGALSRYHAQTAMINLDIGGGTTNPALGRNGEVLSTGCVFIGARHFVFAPGGYRLLSLSPMGRALADELGVGAEVGADLTAEAVDRLVGWYVAGLEALCLGRTDYFSGPAGCLLHQVPFHLSEETAAAAEITFSGGVGELVYRLAAGEAVPGTTAFGDLGLDLARAIAASPLLSRSLKRLVPELRGRATVTGMAMHGTELSGGSLYLSRGAALPLCDLPVLGVLEPGDSDDEFHRVVALAAGGGQGGCVQIQGCPSSAGKVKALARRLADAAKDAPFASGRPLVVLVDADAGKTLGNYLSDWGRGALPLMVVDEVMIRHARFVNLGAMRDGMVPVTYYGFLQMDAV